MKSILAPRHWLTVTGTLTLTVISLLQADPRSLELVPSDLRAQPGARGYFNLPLHFEPNLGQASNRANFAARTAGAWLLLDKDGIDLRLRGSASVSFRMNVVNASSHSRWQAMERLPGISNYFKGRNPRSWITNVPQYGGSR